MLIPVSTLKALLISTPKAGVRYYLNGIAVFPGSAHATLVSTDGHRMAVTYLPIDGRESLPDELIIPIDAVQQAIKGAKKGESLLLRALNGAYQLGSVSFTPTDGKFPAWKTPMPEKTSGELAQYDLKYLGEAEKALRLYQGLKPSENCISHVYHNGDDAAIICTTDPSFFILLMPRRPSFSGNWSRPDWL